MKLSMNLKIINYAVLFLCVSMMNSTVLKNFNTIKINAAASCENSCQGN